jgi:hypothetical protein
MLALIVNFLNPKSKNAKIELSVQPHTKNDFANPNPENNLSTTAANYLPVGDFQVVFGSSIYDIQIVK